MEIKLDEFQSKFVASPFSIGQAVRLKAVAGSGKTTTSTMKIKALIDSGINPESIIFNTFSNKSANDLTVKYNKLVGYSTRPVMSTIHSLSLMVLKKYFKMKPNLLNEWSSIMVMRDALEELKLDEKYNIDNKRELTNLATSILDITQWYKSNIDTKVHIKDIDFKNFNYKDYDAPESIISPSDFALAFKTYEDFKQNNNQFDYSDLVFNLYIMLLQNPDKLAMLKKDYPIIFVDEAQDLDTLLFKLIYLMSAGNSLYLIYDEVQTIYSFRWSAPHMLAEEFLSPHFNSILTYTLEYNYRSTENIVKVGNKCREIANSDVMTTPFKESVKSSVRFIQVKNNLLEGEKTASLIKELITQGYKYEDIAIIARTNSYLKSVIEPILAKELIPYNLQTKNRRKLFDKPLIKAYFDFISLMLNPENQFTILSLALNIKGIGDKFIEKLRRITYTGKSIFDYTYTPQDEQKVIKIRNLISALQPLNEIINPNDLHKAIDKFESIISNYFTSDFTNRKDLDLINKSLTTMVFTYYDEMGIKDLQEIMDKILLDFTEIDTGKSKDAVKLLTIHASKGLEFPVTITGGFGGAMVRDDDHFSDSCILYVQLSRAIDKLIILDSPIYIDRRFRESESKYSNVYRKFKSKLGV